MKYPFRAKTIILVCIVVVACGQASQIAPTSSTTLLPTDTAIPSQTATPQIEATPTVDINVLPTFSLPSIPSPTPNPKIATFPTFIPTINPDLVPELLRKSISIEMLNGVNGHNVQRITGWEHGFRQKPCDGYQWLDSNHLLLYPLTGQDMLRSFADASEVGDLSSRAVVINLTRRTFWLLSPPIQTDYLDCDLVHWSQELGLIINREDSQDTPGSEVNPVVIYTFDGDKTAEYKGILTSVSPSGEKILVGDDDIINLRNNKITKLAWHIDRNRDYSLGILPNLYWSSDETQVYRCCFYYANLNTGKSYSFEWGDLHGPDGKPLIEPMHSPHTDGQWVRNDTYFLPKWSYMSYGGDPTVMFSPTNKNFYILDRPEIQADTASYNIAPNGMYVWIYGYDEVNYANKAMLMSLNTFEATSYDISTDEFEWSPDGKFACLTVSFDNGSSQIHLLSTSSRKLELLNLDSCPSWRPNDHLLAYLTEENQVLAILNPKDKSIKGWKLPSTFGSLVWSPDGSQLLLIAKDGSFWHVSYPQMDNFEQLTQPMSMQGVRDINWSPDGKSVAYVKDTDIYIVEINK